MIPALVGIKGRGMTRSPAPHPQKVRVIFSASLTKGRLSVRIERPCLSLLLIITEANNRGKYCTLNERKCYNFPRNLNIETNDQGTGQRLKYFEIFTMSH